MSISEDQLGTVENQIRSEVDAAVRPIIQGIRDIDSKYEATVKQTEFKYRSLVEKGNVMLRSSDSLINGIDRKIFSMKRRDVEAYDDDRNVIAILDELSKLVNEFEGKGSRGLRNLADSIMNKINSEYKQDEIDRIVALHKALKLRIEANQFEDLRQEELRNLARRHDDDVAAQKNRMSETIRGIVNAQVDRVVSDLS